MELSKLVTSNDAYPFTDKQVVLKSLSSESVKNYETLEKLGTSEGYFNGKLGFGTYSWVLHNLRIPTSARTHAFALNQEESPILGAKYNQYTIHYCVNRGVLGTNAVGDTVKSVTTHVFYVKDDLTDFETKLKTAFGENCIITAGKQVADPADPSMAALEARVAALEANKG